VDIEEFYDADPRRRASREVELGTEWHDAHGIRYELSWVADTGELYVMREPAAVLWPTPFGGVHAVGMHSTDEKEVAAMTVAVVATVPDQSDLERMLDGWQAAMADPDSVHWLVERLHAAGAIAPPGAPPVE
jgi:hypothetical protein